ncbi:histone-like nucleoid-structuring protein Lsr2 [Nocardia jiangxiensis]|uniref:histone-like nucleoid-structuring protein Lsr2 n=1 Tax=Nocardia jiangxiensis TaxID=282685 RepID=UPI0002DA14FA|nr:Lsr2 family protein [Nocardia jiangxiensis]
MYPFSNDFGDESDVARYTFALNGVEYEVDLSVEDYDVLNAALRPFIEMARVVKRAKGSGSRGESGVTGLEADEVREWALANGYEVPEDGPIPEELVEAWEASR